MPGNDLTDLLDLAEREQCRGRAEQCWNCGAFTRNRGRWIYMGDLGDDYEGPTCEPGKGCNRKAPDAL